MSISDKILELQKNNIEKMHLYFINKQIDNYICTTKLNHEQSKNLKQFLKKKNKILSWKQIETNFRNLTKTEKIYNDGTNEIIFTNNYPNDYIIIDNNLIVIQNKDIVDKNNFPSLEEYDNVINKYCESYNFDNFNVVFITQNNETIVYIDIINFNKKENNRIFENILNLLKNI